MKSHKPKIFIIGFNKTATRSLHHFFKQNGLPSVHWDNGRLTGCFEQNILLGKELLEDGVVVNEKVNTPGKYQDMVVFSDMTQSLGWKNPSDYYKRLDSENPGARFILNTRDTESWVKSRMNHVCGPKQLLWQKHLSYFKLPRTQENKDVLKDIYRKIHTQHHEDVLEYFKNRKKDLVVFDIINDRIQKVIKFLQNTYSLDAKHYGHEGKTLNGSWTDNVRG